MIVVGLTGSIGMGKSTTLAMFGNAGIPIHSADESVHRLYAGESAKTIEAEFQGVMENGAINRDRLAKLVFNDPQALKRLETIVHPLVRKQEEAFLKHAAKTGAPFAVIDIPLLFETGAENRVDKVIVVTAPPEMQRKRVLARPGMTVAKFEAIMARQLPDAQKRSRADYVIDTGQGLEFTRRAVHEITRALTSESFRADRNPAGDDDA